MSKLRRVYDPQEAVTLLKEWITALAPGLQIDADESRWGEGELRVTVAAAGNKPVRWVIERRVLELAAAGDDVGAPDRPPFKAILADVVRRAEQGATVTPR
jgi:hypothetical protein